MHWLKIACWELLAIVGVLYITIILGVLQGSESEYKLRKYFKR